MKTTVKRVRDMLGLGQQEMAGFLGISRTRLAQVEIDQKNLPDEANRKLADLLVLLESFPTNSQTLPEPGTGQTVYPAKTARLERDLTRIQRTILDFAGERDKLLSNRVRLAWVMPQTPEGSDTRKIVSMALVLVEEKLLSYSDEHYLKFQKKRVETEAWLGFLRENLSV